MRHRLLALAFLLTLLIPASARAQVRAVTYVTGLSQPVAVVQDPADVSLLGIAFPPDDGSSGRFFVDGEAAAA